MGNSVIHLSPRFSATRENRRHRQTATAAARTNGLRPFLWLSRVSELQPHGAADRNASRQGGHFLSGSRASPRPGSARWPRRRGFAVPWPSSAPGSRSSGNPWRSSAPGWRSSGKLSRSSGSLSRSSGRLSRSSGNPSRSSGNRSRSSGELSLSSGNPSLGSANANPGRDSFAE